MTKIDSSGKLVIFKPCILSTIVKGCSLYVSRNVSKDACYFRKYFATFYVLCDILLVFLQLLVFLAFWPQNSRDFVIIWKNICLIL